MYLQKNICQYFASRLFKDTRFKRRLIDEKRRLQRSLVAILGHLISIACFEVKSAVGSCILTAFLSKAQTFSIILRSGLSGGHDAVRIFILDNAAFVYC